MKKYLAILAVLVLISSMAYTQGVENKKLGVTLFNEEITSDNYRLYSSRNLTAA